MTIRKVKFVKDDEETFHCIHLDANADFNHLDSTIRRTLKADQASYRYEDSDGDMVFITDDNSLEHAFHDKKPGTLRIFLIMEENNACGSIISSYYVFEAT